MRSSTGRARERRGRALAPWSWRPLPATAPPTARRREARPPVGLRRTGRPGGARRPRRLHRSAPIVDQPMPERLAARLVRRARRDEEGQILLLGIGMITLILALILVTASATAVYLDLKALTSMADSAAAAGAAGVDGQSYYNHDPGALDAAPGALTSQGVRAAALEDLTAQARVVHGAGLSGVELLGAQAQDGTTAVVTLRAHSQPPFLPWGIIPAQGFTLTATGTAAITTVP